MYIFHSAIITFNCNSEVIFHSNTASFGGTMYIADHSNIALTGSSTVTFDDNVANSGGIMYIEDIPISYLKETLW